MLLSITLRILHVLQVYWKRSLVMMLCMPATSGGNSFTQWVDSPPKTGPRLPAQCVSCSTSRRWSRRKFIKTWRDGGWKMGTVRHFLMIGRYWILMKMMRMMKIYRICYWICMHSYSFTSLLWYKFQYRACEEYLNILWCILCSHLSMYIYIRSHEA